MTEYNDEKPKVAKWVKGLALLTYALSLGQLFPFFVSGIIYAFTGSDIWWIFSCVSIVPFVLYLVVGVMLWPAGPGHWNSIAALLAVALLINLLLLTLLLLIGWQTLHSNDANLLLIGVVISLVDSILILLLAVRQKTRIEQGE